MRQALLAFLTAGLIVVGVASCAPASSTRWSDLKRVTVTLQNPSLPPPGGEPSVSRFASAARVAKATTALNHDHIAKAATPTESTGCTGGTNVTIAIVRKHGATVTLSAYDCANSIVGDVAGNLSGFLKALGLSA